MIALGLLLGCTCSPVDAPPDGGERWVSLTPAITETIAALGRTDILVARSEWCTQPPSVTRLPAVGSALTPDLEATVRLSPTRVLVDGSDGIDTEPLSQLAPLTVLPWLTVSDVAHSVETLGQMLGEEEEAGRLAARFRALDVPPPADGPEVLLALTEDPRQGDVWFVRVDSLHGSVLHAAGGRNAVPDAPAGAPSLSVEGLLELDPAVVVVLTPRPVDDAVRAEVVANWSTLEPLTAVQTGRVGVLGGPTVLPTGPSLLDTTEALRAEMKRLGAP